VFYIIRNYNYIIILTVTHITKFHFRSIIETDKLNSETNVKICIVSISERVIGERGASETRRMNNDGRQ